MTLYLRNDKNRTLFETDVWVNTDYNPDGTKHTYVELSATVNITNYSNLLLENIKNKNKVIHDFDSLSELRGWLWERYFMVDENDGSQIDDVIKKVKVILTKVAKDYNLNLIVD